MIRVNAGTQKANGILWDYNHYAGSGRDIFKAYNRPSSAKIRSYQAIAERARNTAGYNNDIAVCGAGSHNYSTVYSFTENGTTYIVKDTKANTYVITK